MIAPAKLQFDAENHRYTYEGRIIPSVTQIISAVGLFGRNLLRTKTLVLLAQIPYVLYHLLGIGEGGALVLRHEEKAQVVLPVLQKLHHLLDAALGIL